jgi:hypothetical protein
MTQPPTQGNAASSGSRAAANPDRYLCPDKACKRWIAEHMRTGLLARHRPPGGDAYTLCGGSLSPLRGLPSQSGRQAPTRPATSPYRQPTLFGQA